MLLFQHMKRNWSTWEKRHRYWFKAPITTCKFPSSDTIKAYFSGPAALKHIIVYPVENRKWGERKFTCCFAPVPGELYCIINWRGCHIHWFCAQSVSEEAVDQAAAAIGWLGAQGIWVEAQRCSLCYQISTGLPGTRHSGKFLTPRLEKHLTVSI